MANDAPTRTLDAPVVLGSAAGTAEVQTVTISGLTAGKTFTLTLDGETTAAIKAKAETTAAEVKSKLEALSNVGKNQPYNVVSVTGATGGPFVVTFEADDGDVPALTGTAAEGSNPVVATTTAGESPAEAVTRGTGLADRTEDVSPLTGSSPAKHRADNAATYGD